jgi:hypothetical protein
MQSLAETMVQDNLIDTIAIEFIRDEHQPLLEEYLINPNAGPGSPAEKSFFWNTFHWMRMFNTKEYDDLFRALRKLKMKKPELRICGFDHSDIEPSFLPSAKETANLPKVLRDKIEDRMEMSIYKAVEKNPRYIRETSLAINLRNCIEGRKKTLVLIGAGHVFRLNSWDKSWLSTLEYLELLVPSKIRGVRLALLNEGFFEDYTNPKALRDFQQTQHDYWISRPAYLPVTLIDAFNRGKTGDEKSVLGAYDFIIFGPTGHDTVRRERVED